MKPLVKILALLLVTLWLPATLHCNLEAAGLELEGHEEHAALPDESVPACHDDVCDVVEGGSYVKALTSLRVLPPVVLMDAGMLLDWIIRPLDEPELIVTRDTPSQVRVLQCCWSFMRRTALPVRAPNSVV